MHSRSLLTAALLGAVSVAAPVSAQDAEWDRWLISVAGGPNRGTAARSMVQALAEEAWDDDSPGGWIGDGQRHPWHDDGDYSESIRVGFRFRRWWGVSYQRNTDWIGFASGYRAAPVGLGTWLSLAPEVSGHALIGSLWLSRGRHRVSARIDGGPAVFDARVSEDGNESSRRLGAVLGGGIGLRIWHIRLSLDAQRRYVGDMQYGDYEIVPLAGGDAETFGTYEANFDHDVMLVGIGVTF